MKTDKAPDATCLSAAGGAARRFYALALGLLTLAACAACTTTTRQVSEVRPVLQNNMPSSMSELRLADSALDSGNIELATTLYNKVLQANPKSVAGITGLGNTLYAVGDFTRAGVYYDRAIKIDADAVTPMIGAARVAIHQRRFNDAIKTYRDVLARAPNDPTASAGLGAALDLNNDHAGAQAVLKQALVANPGDPMLSVNLGLSLILGGNPREGANVLLDVTRYPGAPPQARQNLALAYGLMGNSEAAAEILGHDLPKASVQDNLRFYDIQRAHLPQAGGTAPEALPVATVQRVPAVAIQSASVR
jgi:Flp pilus assembly protein TadD